MPRKKTVVESEDEQELNDQQMTEFPAGEAADGPASTEFPAIDGEPPDGGPPIVEETGFNPAEHQTEVSGSAEGPPAEAVVLSGEGEDHNAPLQERGDVLPVKPTGDAGTVPLLLDADGKPQQENFSADDLLLLSEGDGIPSGEDAAPAALPDRAGTQEVPVSDAAPREVPAHIPSRQDRILTIDARDEIQTREDQEAALWHDIQNAYRTRRILTGTLDGVERTESGTTLAVVSYKGIRVAIPVKEMMLHTGKVPTGPEYVEWLDQLHRILSSRLGSEIDFIVKGLDNSTRSVVTSRREAMLRKRRNFYMDANELGEHMIYEGRIVQARVVAVAEKVIRVEVFGVECSIVARGLSWTWIGSAHDYFNVGDRILVRVLRIDRSDVEHLSIRVDARSVFATDNRENLKKCRPQCRYAGQITDVRRGVVYIRLNNGVNAIAHSCYDPRTPGKRDDVSFAVTRLDEEQGVAVGIITRIIKQNL